MWKSLLLVCLLCAPVLSGGVSGVGLAGMGRRKAEDGGGIVGPACWGPGVWPHPSHCGFFSVCRMTGEGVKGILFRCPWGTTFVSRRWRCVLDQYSRCSERPIDPDLVKASMEMKIVKLGTSPRDGRCPFAKPYCSSEVTLTVCAPNSLLIGNVTCPSSCMEDEFGAFCHSEATVLSQEVTTTTTVPTTTKKYELPMLDASLLESAIKITSSLGLGPLHKDSGNRTVSKPQGVARPSGSRPSGLPALTAPVFDLNNSPEEYSYESEQVDDDKPAFTNLTVVLQGSKATSSSSGEKDSEVFMIESAKLPLADVLPQRNGYEGMVAVGSPSNIAVEMAKVPNEKGERKPESGSLGEKEKVEEKLEKERLEVEKLERVKLEKEKLDREKLEAEKLERETLEKEKLEKEKLEREKLEKEKAEREKLEREKLEKEKLERERLEKERIEMEKQEILELEKEKLVMEQEKLEISNNSSNVHANKTGHLQEQAMASPFFPQQLGTVCKRPGLTCINSNVLLECSPNLVPLRAWNCGLFFSRSAVLVSKCDSERDSCVATVDNEPISGEEDLPDFETPQALCKRPGAQCADNATLIHCSEDLRSATVAVCADLFPEVEEGAVCDSKLDACIVGLGGDGDGVSSVHTTPIPTFLEPAELPFPLKVTTSKPLFVETVKHPVSLETPISSPFPVTEKFPGKPYPSNDPSDTIYALFPSLRDQCQKPGLRCFGGRILEACEKENPKPVYRMDCSAVLADSLGAKCEEQNEGEATCVVALRRNTPLLKQGDLQESLLKDQNIYTLELSVVDVTRTFDYYDSEVPPWKCTKVGQYCADDSTLLSCNVDLNVEFALSCGGIAPESVVAFCDHTRDACVVKKISDLASSTTDKSPSVDLNNQSISKDTYGEKPSEVKVPTQPKPTQSFAAQDMLAQHISEAEEPPGGPAQWDFATLSQLYPPDVPLDAYSWKTPKPQASLEENAQSSTDSSPPKRCSKEGPFCLDDHHLGSCSEELQLKFVLPCRALYMTDPAPFCDTALSACLPSTSRRSTTTAAPTTTETTTVTTVTTPTEKPAERPETTPSYPAPFVPQQIPSYPLYDYLQPTRVQFGTQPQIPLIQENQFSNIQSEHLPLSLAGDSSYSFIRPEAYTFFRPNVNGQYSQQPSRLPAFLQNILQNYGTRFPTFSQTFRPPSLSSFPLLNSIVHGFSTLRPPGTFQTNTDYGMYGQDEPYDYNDPQYQHYPDKHPTGYAPVSYQPVSPGVQWTKVNAYPLAGGVSANLYRDILKYYDDVMKSTKPLGQRPQSTNSSFLFKIKPKPLRPEQSYFDHFLKLITQQYNPEVTPHGNDKSDLYKSKLPTSSAAESPSGYNGNSQLFDNKPVAEKVSNTGIMHSSGFQGSISQVNPLTWLDKVEVPDSHTPVVCKRPGMQCVDADSLGACSKELELRYVIPCRNLLPFVTVGKPYCDRENDACGVIMKEEEQSEYPTDFTSYP